MSVDLMVQRSDGEMEMVPLASNRAFSLDWLPVARELDLVWVSLLRTGFPLGPDDVHEVLVELELMRQHVLTCRPEAKHIVSSLERLSHGLSQVDFAAGETVYVG
jgi:hypothetical protein